MSIKSLLIISLAACAATLFAADTVQGQVATARLNVRQSPGTAAKVLCQLESGTAVTVLRAGGGWLEIAMPSAVPVYVSAEYIKDGKTTARVNARGGAGTQFPSFGLIPEGTAVKPVGEAADNWQQIEAPAGFTAFVSAPLVKADVAGLPKLQVAVADAGAADGGKTKGGDAAPPKGPAPKVEAAPFKDLPIVEGSGKAVTVKGMLLPIPNSESNARFALVDNGVNRCFVHTGGSEKFKQYSNKEVQLSGVLYDIPQWKVPVLKVAKITPVR